MKKAAFCMVLLLSLFILFACTTPPPTPAPAPASEPAAAPAPQTPAPASPASPQTPAPPAPPAPPPPPDRAHDLVLDGAEYYTVIKRDTLSHIARLKYGAANGFYYPLIIMASRDLVEDQDLIEPGTVLTIPKIQPNLNDARARSSMKKFFLEVADITEHGHKRPKDAAGLRKLANSW